VYATGKPVVVVLLNGRPLSINWINKYVPGILEGWFPGAKGGTAIAEVLFGDYNPGGKLTVTFPKTVGQIPYNFPTKPNAQWEGEKTRVNGALYYFGHGLSYTTFAYNNLQITPLRQIPSGEIKISVDVQNTGPQEGTEIVQLYIRDVVSSVITYEKNLRGFERAGVNRLAVLMQPAAPHPVGFSNQQLREPDDGHQLVVQLMCDAARQRSDIVGLDARDLGAKPLFVARLKHHVPFPLHGTFTPRLF